MTYILLRKYSILKHKILVNLQYNILCRFSKYVFNLFFLYSFTFPFRPILRDGYYASRVFISYISTDMSFTRLPDINCYECLIVSENLNSNKYLFVFECHHFIGFMNLR